MSSTVAYVYFFSGHVMATEGPQDTPINLPFDTVVRARSPILSDEELREVVEDRVQPDLHEQLRTHGYTPGPAIIRTVTLMHTILVDAADINGPVRRVLS